MNQFVQSHPATSHAPLSGSLILVSCCMFPFRLPARFSDFLVLYAIPMSYGEAAAFFACIYGQGKALAVLLRTSGCTALGLPCRYLLEYGEASNAYNFTPPNTLAFLLLIPLGTAATYELVARHLCRAGRIQ